MAIFIMLNNFFHDFAVALLFACLLVMTFVYKATLRDGSPVKRDFAFGLFRWLNRVIIGSWVFIVAGGIIRILAYQDYEWMEAAGRGQIAALVIKHLLLVSFIVGGTILQLKLKRAFTKHHDES